MNDSDSSSLCDVIPDTQLRGVSLVANGECNGSVYGTRFVRTEELYGTARDARCGGRREPPLI
ncbi:hypothetical protein [Thermodesulforhabdus norvegica]|uniref:Uncharacterized protein n=1 Tax=Thermodesulforhabdus norvegica TaxID=39841 RepID=A0A1I4SBV9_9BACT|nr:hypothetical protein [Thermodesulforhabdus norvegica]SFM61945.1 hypothetical protein SAMN05660836_00877 [Thermodesulforhabdus norvegica]